MVAEEELGWEKFMVAVGSVVKMLLAVIDELDAAALPGCGRCFFDGCFLW